MENTANFELFAVHKIFSEYEERIYAYIEKTPRDTKLCISQYIIIINFKFFQILSFFTIWDGLSLKTISRYCPFISTFNLQTDSTVHGEAGQHRLQPLLFVLQQGQEWKGLKMYCSYCKSLSAIQNLTANCKFFLSKKASFSDKVYLWFLFLAKHTTCF